MKKINKLEKIKGDASLRKFFRNKENKSILVLSKKEKLKNLLIYDAINKILIKNNACIQESYTRIKLTYFIIYVRCPLVTSYSNRLRKIITSF